MRTFVIKNVSVTSAPRPYRRSFIPLKSGGNMEDNVEVIKEHEIIEAIPEGGLKSARHALNEAIEALMIGRARSAT